ncbi:putative NAD dependent epimerase/dehydratase [Mycena crocata]|nr:putative NAD dependent epimerase/dehydratase [Mycena crocata]
MNRHECPRSVPMQVLALGFPRTGTASLKIALETLGYVRTNHGFAVYSGANPEEMPMWMAAIRAKFFGEGTPYGRKEWDRLLGDCQAVADIPHILFAEELIAAYPDAKVVLTNRAPESWWKSYEATVARLLEQTLLFRLHCWLDPLTVQRVRLERLVVSAMFNTDHVTGEFAQKCFTAHYDKIRRLVPQDRLLEFEVQDGWEPLGKFLGKAIPQTQFPRVNDRNQFQKMVFWNRLAISWNLVVKIGGSLFVIALAVILVYTRL